jgi:hypothetical protein
MSRVYIFSTYSDRESNRSAAAALRQFATQLNIDWMDDYVACDERPLGKCSKDATIDGSLHRVRGIGLRLQARKR